MRAYLLSNKLRTFYSLPIIRYGENQETPHLDRFPILSLSLATAYTIRLKKTAAILLLALFGFNLFGYKLLMNLLEQQASISLQHQLDSDQYDANNLVEVKVPVNLPYLSNWSGYEKYQGETEINGIHYKYVKRRLVNDTLVLLCVRNETKNQLRTAQSDFFKQVNDLQTNKKSGDGKDHQSKNPVNDYLLKEILTFTQYDFSVNHHYSTYDSKLSYADRLVKEQPPEA